MYAKDIIQGDNARKSIITGIKKLNSAVSSTLGPRGRNVIIQRKDGLPIVTKDGVTVARHIKLPDPFENMGVDLIRQASINAERNSGDSTTTATILATALIRSSEFMIERLEMSRNDVVNLLKNNTESVIKSIDEIKLVDKSNDSLIYNVAKTSANGDEEIAGLIADCFNKSNNTGFVRVKKGREYEDSIEIKNGYTFDRGLISPFFANRPGGECEFDEAYVLLVSGRIDTIEEIVPVLDKAHKELRRPLVIIADDFDDQVVSIIAANKIKNSLQIALVKSPGYGDRRMETIKDMGIYTDSTPVAKSVGMTVKDGTLGKLDGFVAGRKECSLIVNNGYERAEKRIEELIKEYESATDNFNKDKLQERIVRLSGRNVTIHVGGYTDAEIDERKDRIDDALGAVKSGYEGGFIAGGSAGLLHAVVKADYGSLYLREFIQAMEEPLNVMIANADVDKSMVFSCYRYYGNGDSDWSTIYNFATGEVGDAFEMGVVDSAESLKGALRFACSVACTVIMLDCAIVDIEPKEPQSTYDIEGLSPVM